VKAKALKVYFIYLFKLLGFQPGGRIREVPLILPPDRERTAPTHEGEARRRAGALPYGN
jgi:hypothetical protein